MENEQITAVEPAKTYFGEREVLKAEIPEVCDAEGNPIKGHEVLVEYADGKEPHFEAVHEEEWEAGKSDKPVGSSQAKSEWFVARTLPLRQRVHDLFEEYNPRFHELEKILDWIMQTYSEGFSKCVDLEFGKLLSKATAKDLLDFLTAKEVPWREGMKPATLTLIDLLSGLGITAQELVGRQTVAFLSKDETRKAAFAEALARFQLTPIEVFDRTLVSDVEDCARVLLQKAIDLCIAVPEESVRLGNFADIYALHKDEIEAEAEKPVDGGTV